MCDCREPGSLFPASKIGKPLCSECHSGSQSKQIEQQCYLFFPGRSSFNEFPRLCPTHWKLSKPKITNAELCLSSCLLRCNANKSSKAFILDNGVPRPLDSINDYLKLFHTDGCPHPSHPRGHPESFNNPFRNALEVESFVSRPCSPTATETDTFRARGIGEIMQSKSSRLGVHSNTYRYCRDLGLVDEMARLFVAELRHVTPKDHAQQPEWRSITLTFQPKRIQFLKLREFPEAKFFVCDIRYDAFLNPPNLHFGDQVLEIVPAWVKAETADKRKSGNCFHLRILPSPFYRKVVFRVNNRQVIGESDLLLRQRRGKGKVTRSREDLGFTLHQRRIVEVDKFSPAKMAGLEADYVIIEVDGKSVLEYSDSYIVRLIRNAIDKARDRSVVLAVMTARIYDALVNPRLGRVHSITQNAEFDVKAWSENKIFSVR